MYSFILLFVPSHFFNSSQFYRFSISCSVAASPFGPKTCLLWFLFWDVNSDFSMPSIRSGFLLYTPFALFLLLSYYLSLHLSIPSPFLSPHFFPFRSFFIPTFSHSPFFLSPVICFNPLSLSSIIFCPSCYFLLFLIMSVSVFVSLFHLSSSFLLFPPSLLSWIENSRKAPLILPSLPPSLARSPFLIPLWDELGGRRPHAPFLSLTFTPSLISSLSLVLPPSSSHEVSMEERRTHVPLTYPHSLSH